MLIRKHYIGGKWVDSDSKFYNQPVDGFADKFAIGSPELIDQAVQCAENAFSSYAFSSRESRAKFLREIAKEINNAGAEIDAMAVKETGLPEARFVNERNRTVKQLEFFASYIEKTDYLDIRHDAAKPDNQPLPLPDFKLIQRPIGPVAIFGASNFPLAFSVAGGDTASALAAGCPVVVKGHSAHPGVSDLVAQAIDRAIATCNIDPGVFSLIQGGDRSVGAALVQHPYIKAVGFTGSKAGGRALYNLCAARPEPIPFFGELGSINPSFVLSHALQNRGEEIAIGWVRSLILGAGQFCTNPGLFIVREGELANEFIKTAVAALENVPLQTMLTDGIAQAYCSGFNRLKNNPKIKTEFDSDGDAPRTAYPNLFSLRAADWITDESLAEEVFGPTGIVVITKDENEEIELANSIKGQLTCSIHMDNDDIAEAKSLFKILERKAGRLIVNSYPPGVEVCDSMVHGGPYPASTNFGASSVGSISIRRFLRPICYQGFPNELLPDDLKNI